jgi:hypothetical protein
MSWKLKEENILWVSENRVLKRVFRTKREEVVGGWTRMRSSIIQMLHQILLG